MPINGIRGTLSDLPAGPGKEVQKKDEQKIRQACADFEALFLSHILKSMRQTVLGSGSMEGGYGKDVFMSLFDQEVGRNLARQGGMGLGKIIYEQMAGREVKKPPPSEASGGIKPLSPKNPGEPGSHGTLQKPNDRSAAALRGNDYPLSPADTGFKKGVRNP